MLILGVYDDFYNANFKLKFLMQLIVGKILIDQGFVITNYYGLFGIYDIPWILAQISTLFVFIIVVNSINFIDGIDGLAITDVIKTILLIEFFSIEDTPLYNLGIYTILSISPLYYFNFKKKRKVFLGDAGSMVLGTLVMIYILYVLSPEYKFNSDLIANKTFFSIMVIIYPLFDLLRVFIIRVKKQKISISCRSKSFTPHTSQKKKNKAFF